MAFKNAWIIHIRMGGSVVIVHERRKIDFTVSKAARYSIRADWGGATRESTSINCRYQVPRWTNGRLKNLPPSRPWHSRANFRRSQRVNRYVAHGLHAIDPSASSVRRPGGSQTSRILQKYLGFDSLRKVNELTTSGEREGERERERERKEREKKENKRKRGRRPWE